MMIINSPSFGVEAALWGFVGCTSMSRLYMGGVGDYYCEKICVNLLNQCHLRSKNCVPNRFICQTKKPHPKRARLYKITDNQLNPLNRL